MATKTAVAGEYQSFTGEDFIHCKNNKGATVFSVDNIGVTQIQGLSFPDGTYQGSAASTTGSNIDAGTF